MTGHDRTNVTSRLRLRGFDYTSAATFFVTICINRRACLLGGIEHGEPRLSLAGAMVDSWWQAIPSQFPDVMLDAVTVMPNHLHALLHIGTMPDPRTPRSAISAVIQWFKIRSTNDYIVGVKRYGFPRFEERLWQPGFYEHIVRNDQALDRIRQYIADNPANWDLDELYMA